MKKLLALLLLALPACGADLTLEFEGPTAPLAETTGPAELVEALALAASDWRAAGVEAPHVNAVAWETPESINAICHYPEGVSVLGCAGGARMWLREGADQSPKFEQVVLHELGHLIRIASGAPARGHIKCGAFPGDHLMCDGGSLTGEITAKDVVFVQGAPLEMVR